MAVWEVLGTARLRQLLMGGLAPVQILERLPPETVAALSIEDNPTLARREALEAIVLALDELVGEGRVRRGRRRLKSSIVDVYCRR
ncbi:MAG TPA: hypothetical protein QGF58_11575 [Myxococcota bacterium]|nr:hypothetical protein [Myxococcota bacterium]